MSISGLSSAMGRVGTSIQMKVADFRPRGASTMPPLEMGDYQPDMPHIKDGWMFKKGGVGGTKTWKRRWFVLTADNLIYCARQGPPTGTNVKGAVSLQDAYLVETSATKRELCFQICTPDRTYYFEPLSNTDRNDWIRKLQACLEKRLDTASVLRSGFLLKLGGKVGPLLNSKYIPDALKGGKGAALEEKSKGLARDAQKTKWQKRFFVLRMGELVYYVQQRDLFPPEKRKGTISLKGSYINPDTNLAATHPNSFELVVGDRSYTLDVGEEQGRNMFSNNGDERTATKSEWMASLLLANPTAVFGVPLKVAAERSNGGNPKALVPAPLTMATTWLNTHSLKEEGLYRIPGSKMEVEKFIRMYDSGQQVSVPDNYFGGNLASLVVQFIRRCPESLFTEQYAPVFEQIVDELNAGTNVAKSKHMIRKLLSMLPAVNLATLRCLIDHLLQVASFSEENHMTIDKLCMCVYAKMAPTLGACMTHFEMLFTDLESTVVDASASSDVSKLVQEREARENRERLAKQEREDREERERLKKAGASPNSEQSTDPDSDEDDPQATASKAAAAKTTVKVVSPGGGKKVVLCSCGEPLEEFADFCGECGKRVEPTKPEAKAETKASPKKTELKIDPAATLRCTCGQPYTEGRAFCDQCGSKLSAPTPTRRGLELGEQKCPTCGVGTEVGATFCDQCGNPIPGMAGEKKAGGHQRADSPAPRKSEAKAPGPAAAGNNPPRSDSPAPRLSTAPPPSKRVTMSATAPASTFAAAKSPTSSPAKPLSPFQPERERVASMTKDAAVSPQDDTILAALAAALPAKADKWAEWAAKLKEDGVETIADLKNMNADAFAKMQIPALLRSVLNRIRSGEAMPASRPSEAGPLKCSCGAIYVAGTSFCDQCGNKLLGGAPSTGMTRGPSPSSLVAKPSPAASPSSPTPSATPASATNTSSAAGAKKTAPAPPPFSGTSAAPVASTSPTTAANDKKELKCNCGTVVNTAAAFVFCPECGTKLTLASHGPGAVKVSPATSPSPASPDGRGSAPSISRTPGRLGASVFEPGRLAKANTSPNLLATSATTTGSTVASLASRASSPSTASPRGDPPVSRTTISVSPSTTSSAATTSATTTAASAAARIAALSVASAGPANKTPAAGTTTGPKTGKCAACNEPYQPGTTFCDQCGAKIAPDPGASPNAAPGVGKSPAPAPSPRGVVVGRTPAGPPASSSTTNTTTTSTTTAAKTPAATTSTTTSSTTTAQNKATTTATSTTTAAKTPAPPPATTIATTTTSVATTTTRPSVAGSPAAAPSPTTSPANPARGVGRTPVAVGRITITPSSAAPTPAPSSPKAGPSPSPASGGAKCGSCGASNAADNTFCDQCGAKQTPGASPTTAPLTRSPSVARRIQSPFLQ